MTATYISTSLRQQVIERANAHCEYCLFPQAFSFLAFEIEHIIAEKHGGQTRVDNLALACPFCNRFKGTDLGSLDPETGHLTAFFDPRRQRWDDHFRLNDGVIIPLTATGRVTETIFRLNRPDRVNERCRLIAVGQYP